MKLHTLAIRVLWLMLLCTAFLCPVSASAETVGAAGSVPRPKICLVLSGGGARGAAHVGVLLALEKLHIPVDCIAGTSIGASVGGLYAAGMTPEELQHALTNPDVQSDMANSTSRTRLSYRRRQDDWKYLFRIEFGYRDGKFFLPQGVVSGSDPGRILNILALPYSPDTDFGKLPVPFKAVATDLETGAMVVLDHGNLAEVLRASMAVPGLYPPVRIQDRLLGDGGLVRNLPVDVARGMGADIIIAVNVSTPLSTGKDLEDALQVSLQVIKILGNQNVVTSLRHLTKLDVLISPDLGDITATDFDRMGEAIKDGEQAALAALQPLTALQLSPEEYTQYRDIHRRAPAVPARIGFVEVSGNAAVSSDLILAHFGVHAGDAFDVDRINEGLRRVYQLDAFQHVDVSLAHHGDQAGLHLSVQEKAWHPNFLQFGLHISDDFEGGSSYELLGSYVRTQINRYGAEWRNEFEIGKTRLYYTELFQPLGYSDRFFIAPEAQYLNQTFDVFSGETRVAEYSSLFPHGGVDMGALLGDSGEARVGLIYGHVVSQPRIGDPAVLPVYRDTLVGPRVRLGYDTLDHAGFPTSGSYLFLAGFFPRRDLGSDTAYSKVDFTAGKAFGSDSDSVLALAEIGGALGTTLPQYEQFRMGGFLSLAGRRQSQLSGDRIFDAHLTYAHRIGNLPTGLGEGLYLGAGLDAGNVWPSGQPASWGDMQYGLSAFAGADTVLGPLYVGIGVGQAGTRTFFLYLGVPISGTTLSPSFSN